MVEQTAPINRILILKLLIKSPPVFGLIKADRRLDVEKELAGRYTGGGTRAPSALLWSNALQAHLALSQRRNGVDGIVFDLDGDFKAPLLGLVALQRRHFEIAVYGKWFAKPFRFALKGGNGAD